jgi:TP901 family phage tail tape measure protein
MADFNIVIKVEAGGAIRNAKRVEDRLGRIEKKANSAQSAMKKAFAGVAAGQGAVQSIRFLANFAQEMSTVKAISEATDEQFKQLRETAIDLGTTTRFTATQAASGMLFLARSGFETAEILETIPGVLNLAQAGALDLGRAADITTNILKGFGLATDQTARVVDVLALASNSANTTVEQLGQAMKFVAPIAAGVNMSLEDTAAAMQVLSNAGLQASMAGTGLRRVIGALEGPTTAQQKILARLGLSTDDVKVSQVGLVKALEALQSRTNDAGISLGLFGQRGGPAAIVMGKLTEEMIKFGDENLNKAPGTAQRIADIMDDNLNGALLRVKSAWQGLLILFGDVSAVSGLRTLLDGTAEVLRWFAKNARGLNDALGVLIIGFLAYRAALVKVTIAQIQWRTVMTTAIGPQIIVALTAIIALMVLFKDELTIAGEGLVTFGDIGDVVAGRLNETFAFIAESSGASGDKVENGWRGVISNIVTMGSAILWMLAQWADRFVGFFVGLGKAAKKVTQILIQVFDNAWIDLGNGAKKFIQGALNIWAKGINALADKLNLDFLKIDLSGVIEPFAKIPDEAIITGDAVGKAFMEGLRRTGLEDAFLSILTEAEQKAFDRIKLDSPIADKEPKPTPEPDEIFGPGLDTGGGRRGPTFRELMQEIERETELLKLNSREMEIQQGLFQFQEQLGRGLLNVEKALVASALLRLQQQREMATVYDGIKKPLEDVIAQQQALNSLYLEGRIAVEEYQIAMDKLKITQFELGTTVSDGLSAGLLKIKQSIQDVSGAAQNTLVNAFGSAEQALVDFTTTGEINFSQFVDGILKDMTKLLLRQALLSAIPGLGAASGAIPVINSAQGNDFMVGGSGGTDSQSAMMNFTPGERVTVQTPAQQKAGQGASQSAAPVVNIYNVSDPSDVPINSREGEQSIINIITKNRNAVNNGLAGS